jgi:uncharacterized protein (TIGR00290 family)
MIPDPNHSRPGVMLAWSSGKDSAWALHTLRQGGLYDVKVLLTTVNAEFDRVSMHGVRLALLETQARAAGLPLIKVMLPWPCPNGAYEEAMAAALEEARDRYPISHVAFGDLFLEDIRRYREERLAGTGLTPLFPLWGRPTAELAQEMIVAGLDARITCLDPRIVPECFAGRCFDQHLLADLPASVDPCGENGEFHTFVTAGPMFHQGVDVRTGLTVMRDGFVFCDLILAENTAVEA